MEQCSEMGCLSGISKFCLTIINVVFLLLGFVLVVLGFILRFGRALYEPFLQTGIDAIKKVVTDTPLANFDTNNLDLGNVVQALAIGLIVGGLFLCCISFIGCCGACYKIDCLLWLYIILVTVFFIGEVIIIGIMYGKPAIAKNELKTVSLPEYKGLDSSEPLTLGWNVVMIQFKCCGVDGYKDFDVSKKWNRTQSATFQIIPQLVTPIACCKQLPQTNPPSLACAQEPFKEALNNGYTGCYDTIWDLSFGKKAIAVPVLIICGIIQIAFIVFALMILRSEKESVGPI